MLIRSQHSNRTTCFIVGAIVAIVLFLTCAVLAIALSFVSLPDLSSNEPDSGPTATIGSEPGESVVSVLDVDQGQAVLIVASDGSAALIDAGRSRTRVREEIVPYARSLGVTSLSYLILSHPDQDHVGGMPEVLERFQVETWVDPGIPTTNLSYEESIEIVLAQDMPAVQARAGEEFTLGNNVGIRLLWPGSEFILSGGDPDSNENSTVVLVTIGSVRVLIPGDLENRGEELLVETVGPDLESDILVVGHHGSNTSSTADFLDAVNADVAIISAGTDNPYGHPHDEVMQRLRFRGTDIYRTDLDGTVEVRIRGNGYEIGTVNTDASS